MHIQCSVPWSLHHATVCAIFVTCRSSALQAQYLIDELPNYDITFELVNDVHGDRLIPTWEVAQGGSLILDGKTPEQIGVPQWRTQVTYVPQSRTQQKGTPSELYFAAQVHWQCTFDSVGSFFMLIANQL